MKKLMLALAAFALVFTVGYAQAQMQVDRQTVIDGLGKRGEKVAFTGVDENGMVIEILCSSKSGEWTFMVTTPDGRTLVVAVGEGCEVIAGRAT